MSDSDLLAFLLRFFRLADKHELHDSFWWRTDTEYAPVTVFVNCNDFFDWGSSDLEQVTPGNICVLEQACDDCEAANKHNGHYGTLLFCSRMRGMRPQGAYYRNIGTSLWPLFDACGPERPVGIGNPKEHP